MSDQNNKPQNDDVVGQTNKALDDLAQGAVDVTREAMNKITDVASINVGSSEPKKVTSNEPLPDDHILNKTNRALTDAVDGTIDATRGAMNTITGAGSIEIEKDTNQPKEASAPLSDDHPVKKTGEILHSAAEGTISATTGAMNKITDVASDAVKGTTEATRDAMNKITDVGAVKISDDEPKSE